MKPSSQSYPRPFSKTELLNLIAITPMTQVAKLSLKAGNTIEDIIDAGLDSQYTRAGVMFAIRAAGHRVRKERSDKGQTLRMKLSKLVEEAKALEAKLAQKGSSSPGDEQPREPATTT